MKNKYEVILNENVKDMDDDEFAEYFEPLRLSNNEFIRLVCLSYYTAFHIANLYYKNSDLLDYDLNIILKDVVIGFYGFTTSDIDMDKVELILKKRYNLVFIKKNPIRLKKVK